jgi:methylenetetrahydrofolate dehydrogenase (NADP+) / methenyltetrahydrofolate cyclohydrolase
MAEKINGILLAESIKQNIKNTLIMQGICPGLAIIRVGDDPASKLYVKLKKRAANMVGIEFHEYLLPEDAREHDVLETLSWLNNDPNVHGIVVQIPLPAHLNEDVIIEKINPAKDADGFHPHNIGALISGNATFEPALVKAILSLIAIPEIPLKNKKAIIIANTPVIVKPLMYLFEKQNIVSEYVKAGDTLLKEKIRKSDLVIIAVGQKNFITDADCKKNAIVIDVGINEDSEGGVFGDVDPQVYSASINISWVSPVPGGVGPVTIAMLLTNVLELYFRSQEQ